MKLRVAELRQKSTLRVQVRLLNVLVIEQPKQLIHAAVQAEKGSPAPSGTGLGPAHRGRRSGAVPAMPASGLRVCV
jgi:hypothetical protein